ncbi:50S ribosomal protein L4 [bacterium]|nr:50S ribosomal protein L4 [bacterium]
MLKVNVLDKKGKVLEEKALDSAVFEIESRESVLKQAYVRYLSNQREGSAKTKTRAERSGGGKKPWRQKGTGRARTGSSRNPIWRKGGVVFGPTGTENYTKNMNKRALRLALKMALSDKAKDKRIFLLDKIELTVPKTKEVKEIISNLPINKRILLISDENLILRKSTLNIENILFTLYNQVNVYDVMIADYIVIIKGAYDKLIDTYKELKKTGTKPLKEEKSKENKKTDNKAEKVVKTSKKEDK